MVCYLTGAVVWSKSLYEQLFVAVFQRHVFSYWPNEYVEDYAADALWDSFFGGQEELSKVLELRRITELDALVYGAM